MIPFGAKKQLDMKFENCLNRSKKDLFTEDGAIANAFMLDVIST